METPWWTVRTHGTQYGEKADWISSNRMPARRVDSGSSTWWKVSVPGVSDRRVAPPLWWIETNARGVRALAMAARWRIGMCVSRRRVSATV